jgi:predicted ATPase
MVHEAAPLAKGDLEQKLSELRFHRDVFVLPPWADIYTTDDERDQSFADAIEVHAKLGAWYQACGYRLREVPCLPAPERADYVIKCVMTSDA